MEIPLSQHPNAHLLAPAWAYDAPLTVTHGEGVYLFAEDGRRYLDFVSGYGVTSTDHCHPRVVQAAQEQVGRLIHASTVFYNKTILQLAERLVEVLPSGLELMFFHSGGQKPSKQP